MTELGLQERQSPSMVGVGSTNRLGNRIATAQKLQPISASPKVVCAVRT